MAPLGLMIAWVWREHIAAAAQGVMPADARRLWLVHWLIFTVVSLGFGVYLVLQQQVVDWGLQNHPEVADVPWAVAAVITPIMAGLAVVGWLWHARGRVWPAFLATWAWSLIALAAFQYGAINTHDPMAFIADEAAAVRAVVRQAPLGQISRPGLRLDQHFVFHLRQAVPRHGARQLEKLREEAKATFYVAAPDAAESAAVILNAIPDADVALRFGDYPGRRWVLWRFEP